MQDDRQYGHIVEALDRGRKALGRARLTAGLLRFAGIALAMSAGLHVKLALALTASYQVFPIDVEWLVRKRPIIWILNQ